MVTFRVPTSREFSAFVDYFIPDYAAEIVSNYRLSEVDAVEQARRELEASFPDGEKSAAQVLLCIILSAPEKEHHIGYLWYKPDPQLHSAWWKRAVSRLSCGWLPEIRRPDGFMSITVLT